MTTNVINDLPLERMMPGESDDDSFWEHIYRYRFATGFVRHKRVLDIASGEGYGVAGLIKAGAASAIGVDVSDEAVSHAIRKYGDHYIVGAADKIPLKTHECDVVVSFETIEHLCDPAPFISECARVLSSLGTLILSTPNVLASAQTNPFHRKELSMNELAALLSPFFFDIRYYDQVVVKAPIWSLRSVCAYNSPWMRMRGAWRLRDYTRKWLCPHICNKDSRRYYGDSPSDAIVSPLRECSVINPYVIRDHLCGKKFMAKYIIVVAKKK